MTDLEKLLLASLKETVQSLEAHLEDEAAEQKLSVEQLCPCSQNEVVRAKAAIFQAERWK